MAFIMNRGDNVHDEIMKRKTKWSQEWVLEKAWDERIGKFKRETDVPGQAP